jgi:hypothetical protein
MIASEEHSSLVCQRVNAGSKKLNEPKNRWQSYKTFTSGPDEEAK